MSPVICVLAFEKRFVELDIESSVGTLLAQRSRAAIGCMEL